MSAASPARPSRTYAIGEVVVRPGERRVEAQRGFEGTCRLVELAELEVRVAEVEVLEGDLPPAGVGGAPSAASAASDRGERAGDGDGGPETLA